MPLEEVPRRHDEEREDERVRFGQVERPLDVVLGRRRGRRASSRATASSRSALTTEKSRTIGAVPSSTGARTSMAPRGSPSASRIAARAARVSANSRPGVRGWSPARPEPPARRPSAPASAPGARGPDRQWIGRDHQGLEPLRLDELGEGLREPSLSETLDRRARSARAAPWRARRSAGVACSARSSHGCASSNRPCQTSTTPIVASTTGAIGSDIHPYSSMIASACAASSPLRRRASAARPPRRDGRGSPSPRRADRSAARAPGPRSRCRSASSPEPTTARRCRGSSARRPARRCAAAISRTVSASTGSSSGRTSLTSVP